MPKVGRVFADFAGGAIATGSSSVLIDGLPVAIMGSRIQDHGRDEHGSATMIECLQSVVVENIPICITGNKASCGHPLISNSSVEAL